MSLFIEDVDIRPMLAFKDVQYRVMNIYCKEDDALVQELMYSNPNIKVITVSNIYLNAVKSGKAFYPTFKELLYESVHGIKDDVIVLYNIRNDDKCSDIFNSIIYQISLRRNIILVTRELYEHHTIVGISIEVYPTIKSGLIVEWHLDCHRNTYSSTFDIDIEMCLDKKLYWLGL